ncbi:Lrp/AsnC family transcriptional regulator [Streptomyces sp. NPDC057302]|uniref:Lrp/AsnC family transcriptional regulator n=1 Tax=Streptomyces sp. NPDC057302 TaxID=3346094 RepID=UPI003634B50F
MVSGAIPDETDQRLVQELLRDARAPFARIAEAIGVSEHTVARRYRRLHHMGLRVIGVPGTQHSGPTRWMLRVHCAPDAATKIADALARRDDTSWVVIASGGTELHCAVDTYSTRERDALLLDKLPHTPRVVSVQAHLILQTFAGTSDIWYAPLPGPDTPQETRDEAAAADPAPDAVNLQLMAELAKDGRTPLTELAHATGRSPAGITRRLERLRATRALHLAVDYAPEYLGFHVLVRFWLRIAPGQLGTVGTALADHPEIPFVAATTGASHMVATGMFHNTQELYQYLDHRIGALPGVESIETAPILREVKRLTYHPTSR